MSNTDERLHEKTIRDVRALLAHRVGKSNAITARELSTRLGGGDGHYYRQTRLAVREVMERYNIPVASHGGIGFFIVETKAEYLDAIAELEADIEGIQERKELLRRAWERNERPDPQHGLTDYTEAEAEAEAEAGGDDE